MLQLVVRITATLTVVKSAGQSYLRQRQIDIKRFVCSRCHGKLRLLKKASKIVAGSSLSAII